jgi:hypothetical protein
MPYRMQKIRWFSQTMQKFAVSSDWSLLAKNKVFVNNELASMLLSLIWHLTCDV